MRVLIIGATGMLGHKLWQQYQTQFDTWVTARASYNQYAHLGLYERERFLAGVDVTNLDTVIRAVGVVRPDVVINCVGVIKQLPTAKDPIVSLTINALFPHRLANICQAAGARLIHISTDCVFSGRKGMYTEADVSDAEDLYGRSKFLGEVRGENVLTLRTSIIGRELQTTSGLIEWFLSNRGQRVNGYTQAIYSGLTTEAVAHIMAQLIQDYPTLSGIYQLSSTPINKYDLLTLVRDKYDVDITIDPYDEFAIDRSLDSGRFRAATQIEIPTWFEMIEMMANDPTPYERWRK